MDKKAIREAIRKKRKELSKEERDGRSERICRRIEGLREYEEAEIVYAYLAMSGEALLDALIEDAWRRGKTVAVPRVEGKEMGFYRLTDLEEVQISTLGIRESLGKERIEESRGALFLMPGLAFDRAMNRVGQGGGYYDRYLEKREFPLKLGVAFDFQILPEVPAGPHDRKADKIVTESEVYPPQEALQGRPITL